MFYNKMKQCTCDYIYSFNNLKILEAKTKFKPTINIQDH